MNVAECDRMIAAAAASGVKLGVAYYRHFYPVVARAREIIESGEIGVPVLAQINAFEYFDPAPDHPRAWLLRKSAIGWRAHVRFRMPSNRSTDEYSRANQKGNGADCRT